MARVQIQMQPLLPGPGSTGGSPAASVSTFAMQESDATHVLGLQTPLPMTEGTPGGWPLCPACGRGSEAGGRAGGGLLPVQLRTRAGLFPLCTEPFPGRPLLCPS